MIRHVARSWTPDVGRLGIGYFDDDGVPHFYRGDPAVMDWVRANGLDPGNIVDLSVDDVERGPIRVVELYRNESGTCVIDPDTGGARRLPPREVPLAVPVPAMFLRTERQ